MNQTGRFDAVRADTLTVVDELVTLASTAGPPEVVDGLRAAQARLDSGQLTVMICGEFKRGKSTLLNALLDMPGLLPTDTLLTTSVVSEVSYADEERVTVLVPDDTGDPTRAELRAISRADIARYATESANIGGAPTARLLSVAIPHPKLASGLTFVDTPGVGGMHRAHTAATMEYLPCADAVLFVMDVRAPMTDSERIFLQTAIETVELGADLAGLACVITKADLEQDYPVLVRNAREKLAQLTGRPEGEVTVLPVSSTAKLDYLASGDAEDLELSNFPELERFLWMALSRRRARLLLGDALTAAHGAVAALLHPIHVAQEALTADDEQQRREIARRQEEQTARLAALDDADAAWRAELLGRFASLSGDLARAARDGMDRVWQGLDLLLRSAEFLDNPDRIADQLHADAMAVCGAVHARAERRAADILRDFSTEHQLVLQLPEIDRLPAPPVPPLPGLPVPGVVDDGVRAAQQRSVDDASALGGLVGLAVGIGLGIGIVVVSAGAAAPGAVAVFTAATAGASAGAPAGNLLGKTVGMWAEGRKESKGRQARQDAVRTALRPGHDRTLTHLLEAADDVVDNLTRRTTAELLRRIRQERASIDAAVAGLHAVQRDSTERARSRAAELATARASLVALRARITTLAEDAEALAAPTDVDAAAAAPNQHREVGTFGRQLSPPAASW